GRINDADLESTLRLRYPTLLDGQPVQVGNHTLTPAELLRADLLTGDPAPKPPRRNMTRSEQTAPQVADQVDAQAAKGCAAYFGAPAAGWPMPDHQRGFYQAWRALSPSDYKLSRRARTSLRMVPQRPDDAVLQALEQLGVAEDDRIIYFQ
ncbi:putative inorganic carbon transporter subunit DabA, partial [Mycobacterium sp.]|uniref:putative inorganic carbon transporter subunit DabA n=1 Tax=Mycobacterium sp. TaxID=1785 RepID=UPI00126FE6CF